METRFELMLPNARKRWWIGAGITGLWVTIIISCVVISRRWHLAAGDEKLLFYAILAGSMCVLLALPWILRRLAFNPHLLVINEDMLSVRNLKTGARQNVSYETLATYRFYSTGHNLRLRLRFKTGHTLVLTDHEYGIAIVEPALTEAVFQHEQKHQELPKQRKDSFFEQPDATWILLMFTGAFTLILSLSKSQFGLNQQSFWTALTCIGFGLYARAWFQARQRRHEF